MDGFFFEDSVLHASLILFKINFFTSLSTSGILMMIVAKWLGVDNITALQILFCCSTVNVVLSSKYKTCQIIR